MRWVSERMRVWDKYETKEKEMGEKEKTRTRAGARSLSRKEDDIIHTLPDRARESTHTNTITQSMWLNSITVKFTIQLKQIFWFARNAKCFSVLLLSVVSCVFVSLFHRMCVCFFFFFSSTKTKTVTKMTTTASE